MLAPIYYGARDVTSNKPIHSPADMKGMKIRVPDAPLMLMFPKSVGANPSPIAFNEVYLALQQGVVEAQENPLPTIKAKKFYEVQKYITLTQHMLDSQAIIISGSRWAKLSDADKKIFREVYQEAAAQGGDDVDSSEKKLVDWFRGQGITVNAVDKAPFIKMAEKAVYGPDATWPKEYYQRLQALK
jgi:TRAP-type C4-dicarboxylate transport system substrate-binding protein